MSTLLSTMRPSRASLASLCLILTCSGVAQAGFTTSQSAFAAANPGLSTLTFEGYAAAGTFLQPAPSFTPFGVTFTTPTNGSADIAIASSTFFFHTPTDVLFVNAFNSPLVMTFAPTVQAVGFNVVDGYNGGPVSVSLFNGANLVATTSVTTTGETDFTTFIGASGFGPITQVTVTPSSGGFVMIDNLSFGTPVSVPEPSSLALCTIGGLALLGQRLSRRRVRAAS